MCIAALYDIHGNLPALEAVLKEIHKTPVEQIVVGGDVVSGPMPREVLSLLETLSIPVHYVLGNGDREVAEILSGTDPDTLDESIRAVTIWTAQQLSSKFVQTLSDWVENVILTIGGLDDVLFCHATPFSDTDVFTKQTPEERIRPLFEAAGVPTVICGHTHMQFDRKVGAVRVINAGSIGMPYADPGAYWLLIKPSAIEFRYTQYDFEEAAKRIRETSYPDADGFAQNNVLHPPTTHEAIKVFTRAEPWRYLGV